MSVSFDSVYNAQCFVLHGHHDAPSLRLAYADCLLNSGYALTRGQAAWIYRLLPEPAPKVQPSIEFSGRWLSNPADVSLAWQVRVLFAIAYQRQLDKRAVFRPCYAPMFYVAAQDDSGWHFEAHEEAPWDLVHQALGDLTGQQLASQLGCCQKSVYRHALPWRRENKR